MKRADDIYQLARRARDGDRDALGHLIDAVRARLLTRAYAVTGNFADAQDAVAGTIVEVCQHIGQLRDPRGITAWMQRIVHREATRLSRKPTMASLSGDEVDMKQDVLRSILQMDVKRALTALPTQHAEALQLFYWDDLSLREVAAEMSTQTVPVNVGQVKIWLHRGRQQLARTMKGYEEMKTTQKTALAARRAGLFCSNLPDAMIATVTDAMRAGGFTPDVITDMHVPSFTATQPGHTPTIWTRDHIAQSQTLTKKLKQYDILVFDEQIGTRSGLEYSLFCKSAPETVHIPITLLYSQPADAVFIQACATVGFAHLIDKSNLAAISAAFRKAEGSNIWQHFSEDARQVIYFCQEAAANLQENYISTEHLLLGLVRDPTCPGAQVLDAHCGTSLEAVRTELARHLRQGHGRNEALDMNLSPRCKRVVDLSVEEAIQAGQTEIGSQHLLLGLIGERDGLAGKVLATLGVDLEKTRVFVSQMVPN